jgi:hypothetical protein
LELYIATAHAVVTWYLVGLIWVIQRVHYPLMHFVDSPQFVEFEKKHTASIGQIVAAPMLFEALMLASLCVVQTGWAERGWQSLGWLLLVIIWGSTFFVQVPIHNALVRGKDTSLIDRLVYTNWIRTVAWTMRGAVALIYVRNAMF